MEELIDIVNQLQDVFSVSGLLEFDLPQIVVVGTQSSGKSSVLEHLVGRSFLPRGPGVVTRCPLVLQLVNSRGYSTTDDYAIFQHNKTKVFTDYRLLTNEIEEQTDRLAGGDKGICSTPIFLKMYSTTFTNLTLVDLPGITKVPVGSQPEDIEQQTKELAYKYISNLNCIILAVTPANADMATCEGLKIAREVDPEGARTLAVVTKLDLMDEGTDAKDMLSGRIITVKLGIIGVVNRSQKGIMENKSIKQSLKDEAAFFYKNYKGLESFHGTPYLTKTIQTILICHIKRCLPKLKDVIGKKLQMQRLELHRLGDNKLNKPTLLLDIISKFSSSFCAAINGTLDCIETNELCGGARINFVFQETLTSALKSIDPLLGLSKNAVLTAIQNASGTTSSLFVPKESFELLVKRQIKYLRSPCLQCVDLIYIELIKIVEKCVDNRDLEVHRFPKLRTEMSSVALDLLQSRLPITNEMVNNFVDVNLAYINTAHSDFFPHCAQERISSLISSESSTVSTSTRTMVAVEQLTDVKGSSNVLDSLLDNKGKLIQKLIVSYFSIVRKTIEDVVPKIVMHFLVNFVMEHLQSELVSRLYRSGDSDLLQESPELRDRRNQIMGTISTLEKATSILNSLRSPKRYTYPTNSPQKTAASIKP